MTDVDHGRGRRVLITGLAGTLAGRLALALEADEDVEYVGGVDLTQPSHELSRTEFIRADLRNPLVAKVIESTRVDTIVHLSVTSEPGAVGGRGRMKELNVIGTMQMLAAAQRAPRVRTLVVRSSTAVYGSHYRDPALFREDSHPRAVPRGGYTQDVTEVETYTRAFGRRRQDVDTTILRFANVIGPDVHSTTTRYFSLPVIPTVLGYDPRLQLLQVDDAVQVMHESSKGGHPGVYNVAGPGVIYLSQAARMTGRPTVSIPARLTGPLSNVLRPFSGVDFTSEQLPLLQFGRVGAITRLRNEFDFEPRYSTRAALQQFIDSGRVTPVIDRTRLVGLEARLGDALSRTLKRVT